MQHHSQLYQHPFRRFCKFSSYQLSLSLLAFSIVLGMQIKLCIYVSSKIFLHQHLPRTAAIFRKASDFHLEKTSEKRQSNQISNIACEMTLSSYRVCVCKWQVLSSALRFSKTSLFHLQLGEAQAQQESQWLLCGGSAEWHWTGERAEG